MIRLALERDAEQIADIYAPVVRHTPISFEVEPPTVAEMARRVAETLPSFPWLVVDKAGEILGYIYAGKHRVRPASCTRWIGQATKMTGRSTAKPGTAPGRKAKIGHQSSQPE